jgi:hypothetical protein
MSCELRVVCFASAAFAIVLRITRVARLLATALLVDPRF